MTDPAGIRDKNPARLFSDAGWRAVVAAFALNGLLMGVWVSRIPAFKAYFNLDPWALGLLLLFVAAGAIASFPVAGWLIERLGGDRLTIFCALLFGPALVAISLAPSVFVLGLVLFVFGALFGAMDVAMNSWGARVEATLGRSTMSFFHAMWSLGGGIGAASSYFAIRAGISPFPHFVLVAACAVPPALWLMANAPRLSAENDAQGGTQPKLALPAGPLLLVGLIGFSAMLGEGAIADWGAVFLRATVEASEAQAALGFAVFSSAMVAARLSGDFAVQRMGPVLTTRVSGMIAFCGLAMAIAANTLAPALAGFALVGIGYAVMMPLIFSRAANDARVRPGPAIASVATLGYGGLLLGPPVIGFVAELTGLRYSFLILLALALMPIVLASQMHVEKRGP